MKFLLSIIAGLFVSIAAAAPAVIPTPVTANGLNGELLSPTNFFGNAANSNRMWQTLHLSFTGGGTNVVAQKTNAAALGGQTNIIATTNAGGVVTFSAPAMATTQYVNQAVAAIPTNGVGITNGQQGVTLGGTFTGNGQNLTNAFDLIGLQSLHAMSGQALGICSFTYSASQMLGQLGISPGVTYLAEEDQFDFSYSAASLVPNLSANSISNRIGYLKANRSGNIWPRILFPDGTAPDITTFPGWWQMTIGNLVYIHWQKTHSPWAYTNCLSALTNGFNAFTFNRSLIYWTNSTASSAQHPAWWGLDVVPLSAGYDFAGSVFLFETCSNLSRVATAVGDTAHATQFNSQCAAISSSILTNCWDSTTNCFWWFSATNRFHSVIGSAYAVAVGAVTGTYATNVANALLTNSSWCDRGCPRYVPPNEFMVQINARTDFTKGYFPAWAGYVAKTLALVSPSNSFASFNSYLGAVQGFGVDGPSELIFPPSDTNYPGSGSAAYLLSFTIPEAYVATLLPADFRSVESPQIFPLTAIGYADFNDPPLAYANDGPHGNDFLYFGRYDLNFQFPFDLFRVASNGIVYANGFNGPLNGNASTATLADTANSADVAQSLSSGGETLQYTAGAWTFSDATTVSGTFRASGGIYADAGLINGINNDGSMQLAGGLFTVNTSGDAVANTMSANSFSGDLNGNATTATTATTATSATTAASAVTSGIATNGPNGGPLITNNFEGPLTIFGSSARTNLVKIFTGGFLISNQSGTISASNGNISISGSLAGSVASAVAAGTATNAANNGGNIVTNQQQGLDLFGNSARTNLIKFGPNGITISNAANGNLSISNYIYVGSAGRLGFVDDFFYGDRTTAAYRPGNGNGVIQIQGINGSAATAGSKFDFLSGGYMAGQGAGKLTFGTNGFFHGSLTVSNGWISAMSNALSSVAGSALVSDTPVTNTFGYNIFAYVDNTGVTGTALKKNGQQISGSLLAGSVVTIPLKTNDYFSVTFTVGTPTWRWDPQ